ncbi:MAG: hypothetical protein JO353_07775 [Phycisphaerae bacterium]|nr:hypothetical protein [Phycisphaerae bacterium]
MRTSFPRPLLILICAAIAAGFCFAETAAGQTAPTEAPTTAELMRQIQSLQSQVQQLQDKQSRDEAASIKQQDETVERVLSDARMRSEIIRGGNAGWDKGHFFLSSAGGNFVARPWLQAQTRYAVNWRDGAKTSGANDAQSGFEIRRLRLGIDGNVFTPQLTYLFNFATYPGSTSQTLPTGGSVGLGNGGNVALEEAWLKYSFAETPWSIRAGQFHNPLDHEAIIGPKYRGGEASLTTDIFANTENYVQGVTIIYDTKDDWRFEGGFTDGIRSSNTNFQDYPNSGNGYDFGFAGRLEYKLMGDWKDYSQLTALGNTRDLLVMGAGLDESQGGNSDTFSHTFDIQYANTNGFLAYGSYFGRYTSNNRGIPLNTQSSVNFSPTGLLGQDTYEYSVLGQAAYMIDGNIEPYVRYEYMHLAGTPAGSNNEVHALSAGVNYYLYGHNAKLSGQVTYLPNGIPISDEGNDVLSSNNKGEFAFFVQFQLML